MIQSDQATKRLASQLGKRFRQARKGRRLTLKVVAEKCATTPQTVQRLEAATMSLSADWIERLCHVLEIEPANIIQDTPHLLEMQNAMLRMREEAAVLRLRACQFIEKIDEFLAIDTNANLTKPNKEGSGASRPRKGHG